MKEYGAYHQLWCYYPYQTDAIDYNQNIQKQMKVCNVSTNLNVRKSPAGEIVGKLKNNNIVTVYEKIGGWARIGDNRWVSLSYLTANLKPEGTLKKTRYVLGKYVTNVRTALNVRVSPSTTALVVCVLESGSKVSITDDSDPNFYKVYTETGAYGFCMKQFITVE